MTAAELDDPKNPYNTARQAGPAGRADQQPGQGRAGGRRQPGPGNWIYFVAVDKAGTTKFAATDVRALPNINEAIATASTSWRAEDVSDG